MSSFKSDFRNQFKSPEFDLSRDFEIVKWYHPVPRALCCFSPTKPEQELQALFSRHGTVVNFKYFE